MPIELKRNALDTDVPDMSELTEPRVAEGYHFDHEMPRLAAEPTHTPAPQMPDEFAPGQEPPPGLDAAHAPRLPGEGAAPQMTPPPADVAPPPLPNTVAIEPGAPNLPNAAPEPSLAPPAAPSAFAAPAIADAAAPPAPAPAMPDAAPAAPIAAITEVAADVAAEAEAEAAANASPHHPMAHLMPQKPEQTEAGRRAAEQRAAKKKKSKRIKIGLTIAFLVVAAVAGPPLGKWLANAVNEAGDTTPDEPVVNSGDGPATPPDTEQGRIDALIDETRERTEDINNRTP